MEERHKKFTCHITNACSGAKFALLAHFNADARRHEAINQGEID